MAAASIGHACPHRGRLQHRHAGRIPAVGSEIPLVSLRHCLGCTGLHGRGSHPIFARSMAHGTGETNRVHSLERANYRRRRPQDDLAAQGEHDVSSQAEWAHGVIAALASRAPDVIRWATLSSVAVRIEPHLIRRLRLNLLPDADVGTEADLWFSPLVESRGADAVVFGNAIVKELWPRLVSDALRDEAIDITLR